MANQDCNTSYFSCDMHDENINSESISNAIKKHLEDSKCKIGDRICVYEFRVAKLDSSMFEVLDELIETLNENYMHCDCDRPVKTPRMIEAEKAFCNIMVEEYHHTLLDLFDTHLVEVTSDGYKILPAMEWTLEKSNKSSVKYLAQQDDCSPDSLETFSANVERITGKTISWFEFYGEESTSDDGLHIEWRLDGFVLEFDGDDPFALLGLRENFTF